MRYNLGKHNLKTNLVDHLRKGQGCVGHHPQEVHVLYLKAGSKTEFIDESHHIVFGLTALVDLGGPPPPLFQLREFLPW